MRATVLVLFVLGLLGRCCLAVEEDYDSRGSSESCSQYCDGTYPKHTYPNPEDHTACARGCRLANMDALIAWPFAPDPTSCLTTCAEAYLSGHLLYACQLGCAVTTIDQQIPNRDNIYQTQVNDSEVGFVVEMVQDLLPLLSDDITKLTQHAERLYQLLPCGEVTTFVFIEDDGESLEILYGYNFDSSVSSSNYEIFQVKEEDPHSSETSSYRFSCPWKYTRHSVTGTILCFMAVILVLLALFACCARLMPENTEGSGEDITEKKKKQYKMEVVYVPTHLKSPVTVTPGYPQPVPYYGKKKNTQF
jgi:hypothetical protein